MPNFIELDSSTREENPTIILGKNILLKIIEDSDKQALLKNDLVKKFVSTTDLSNDDLRTLIDKLMEQEAYITAPSLVQALLRNKDKLEELATSLGAIEQIMAPIIEAEIFKEIQEDAALVDPLAKKLSENKELLQDFMFRIKGKIDKKLIKKHEEKLLAIDKEIEKKLVMDL